MSLLIISGVGSCVAFSLVDLASKLWIEPLGLEGLADIAGFPMLMLGLSLIGLVGLPIQNGCLRHFERQADRFATSLGIPSAFAAALQRLGGLNLADPNPPRWVELWLYDHPPLVKRIRAAEAASP